MFGHTGVKQVKDVVAETIKYAIKEVQDYR